MPKLQEEAKSELGDTIVVKGSIRSYPGLRLVNDFTLSNWRGKAELKATILKAEFEDAKWVYYWSENPWIDRSNLGGVRLIKGGISQSKTNEAQFCVWHLIGNSLFRGVPISPEVTTVDVTEILPKSFQQELIYNGRSGSTLKFMYREISDNYLRTAFTQEVQYDLNDGMSGDGQNQPVRVESKPASLRKR